MRRLILNSFLVLLLAAGSSGCSTIYSFARVYGGTRVDFALLNASTNHHPHNPFPNWMYVTYAIIDLPFSFVLDTVLLPVTVPWALIASSDASEKQPDKQTEKKKNEPTKADEN